MRAIIFILSFVFIFATGFSAAWALDEDTPKACPSGQGWDRTNSECKPLDAAGKLPSGEFPATDTFSEPETAKTPTPDRL